MAYIKNFWHNNIPPSIDEVNLNHMEEGIYQNSLRIEDLISNTNDHEARIKAMEAAVLELQNKAAKHDADIASLQQQVDGLNSSKANKSDVYTKSETDALLATKASVDDLNALDAREASHYSELKDDIVKVKTTVENKMITTSDFYVTRSYVSNANPAQCYTSSRNYEEYATIYKSGYYPIALVGVQANDPQIVYGYITNQTAGSVRAVWIYKNENSASINGFDMPKATVSVLWVRIKS